MPSRNEISATIGSASAPTRSQMRQTSRQRTLSRMARRVDERRGGLADELDLRADVAPDASAARADLLDRAAARRLRIEVVLEDPRVELLQQRGERRLEVGDLDAGSARRRSSSTNSATPAPSQ